MREKDAAGPVAPKILIVEDDLPLRFLWYESLCEAGFDCETAATLPEAEAWALSDRFDLVILDLFLGADTTLGLSDLIALRHPGTAVMLITGSPVFHRGEHAQLAPGISWSLQKPVRPADLVAMAGHLARRRSGAPEDGCSDLELYSARRS